MDVTLGDYFTKPLQGNLFHHMHNNIMNIEWTSKYHSAHGNVLCPNEMDEGSMGEDQTNPVNDKIWIQSVHDTPSQDSKAAKQQAKLSSYSEV